MIKAVYKTLYLKAAKHLSGHENIVIRWQKPFYKGIPGLAYRDKNLGAGVIDLDPDFGLYSTLRLFLHEVGHLREDWDSLTPGNIASRPPESEIVTPARRSQMQADPSEPPATMLMHAWLDYAEKHFWCHFYACGGDEIAAKLTALLDWEAPQPTRTVRAVAPNQKIVKIERIK